MRTGRRGAMNYKKDIYEPRLQEGLEFQDFVAEVLYRIGLPLFNYNSKKYQIECGENKLGVEIKKDNKFAETGNFWIEIAEKSDPQKRNYFPSGIFRSDNTWLYVIGNEQIIYVFAKTMLQLLSKTNRYRILENGTKTSQGFLLKKEDADKYAAKIIEL